MSPSSDILIRGDAAAQAQAINLVLHTAGRTDLPVTKLRPNKSVPAPTRLAAATDSDPGRFADERQAARKAGFEQGRNEGLSQGLQEGRQQMQEQSEHRLAELADHIDTILAQIDQRSSEICDEVAAQTTDLALEIAAAVITREVTTSADPGADAIARCLEMAPSTGDVVARLHPADLAQLGEVIGLGKRKLSVTADPSLQRGDAVVSVDDATIDGRLTESLRRVGEALR